MGKGTDLTVLPPDPNEPIRNTHGGLRFSTRYMFEFSQLSGVMPSYDTETLLADLETCLRRYVQRAPAAAGDVDWSTLAALAAATPAEAAVAVNVDKRKRPDHPHGHHGYCGAYADAIADVVRRADRHIFRAFNYTTCCGPAGTSTFAVT